MWKGMQSGSFRRIAYRPAVPRSVAQPEASKQEGWGGRNEKGRQSGDLSSDVQEGSSEAM